MPIKIFVSEELRHRLRPRRPLLSDRSHQDVARLMPTLPSGRPLTRCRISESERPNLRHSTSPETVIRVSRTHASPPQTPGVLRIRPVTSRPSSGGDWLRMDVLISRSATFAILTTGFLEPVDPYISHVSSSGNWDDVTEGAMISYHCVMHTSPNRLLVGASPDLLCEIRQGRAGRGT